MIASAGDRMRRELPTTDNRSRVRGHEPERDSHQRCLAGTVLSDQRVNGAAAHDQRSLIECNVAAKSL